MLLRAKTLKSLCAVVAAIAMWAGAVLPTTAAAAGSVKVKKAEPRKTAAKPAARKPVVRKVASSASKGKQVRKTTVARNKPAPDARRVKIVQAVAPAKSRVAVKPTAAVVRTAIAAPRESVGQSLGLHGGADDLALNSSVALVVDQATNEVLFSKNDHAVLPIASLTKLMTGLVIVDAGLDMEESITITTDDVDTLKGSRSRLAVGTTLTRGELMHLSLMSSENRAAHALGRTYPGGLREFVRLMNVKAAALGMRDTRYVEPTGLSSENRASAHDLATLVSAAYKHPMLRDLSTSPGYEVGVGRRTLQYNNSNRLIKNPDWDIGLQKTGYISEAGRCLVMQARVGGRQLIMVFLDATGQLGRVQDAERVRRWVEMKGGDVLEAARPRPQG